MRKIALTGNIASGKSVVQKILEDFGFKVLDTDLIGHKLLENNEQVKTAFSGFDIMENGVISREKLGKIVFNDKKLLSQLNSILHPEIREYIVNYFNQNGDNEIIFVAIPLLFEASMQDLFDEIVFVYADDKLRLQRLMQRNNFDENYAKQRINSQMPQVDKIAKSDIIIKNEGSIEELKQIICDLFKPVQKS